MPVSRRHVLKMGAALAAVPLAGDIRTSPIGEKVFSTGLPELDHSLAGGFPAGSFLAVLGPRGSGKSAFFMRLAKANGILDAYPMSAGTTDMLSIMERQDGSFIGSLMLDAAEPSTDKERADMATDPAARDLFLTRWFQRTCDVTHESGGLFAVSACQPLADSARPAWFDIPDYVIAVNGSEVRLIKRS